jgi:hypothetical protein
LKEVRENTYKELFVSKSGIVAHSSSLLDGKNVYLFCGVSESGKSTMAKKMSETMIPINDEKNILEFTEKGIKVSTFFLKEEDDPKEYLVNENATGYLKIFFFPIKEFEKTSFVEPLKDKTYVWKTLLTCLGPPTLEDNHYFSAYLELIDRLMDSVPVYKFYHNLNDPPEYIAKLLRGIV